MKLTSLHYLLLALTLAATTDVQAEIYRYRLHLDGRPEATVVPLSERALQRRARQHIDLDSTDMTLSPIYLEQLDSAGLQRCASSHWLNTVVVCRPDGMAVDEDYWLQFPFVLRVDEVSGATSSSAPQRHTLIDDLERETETDTTAVIITRTDYSRPIYEVHGEALHEAGYRGGGMLIGVIDAGFYNTDQYAWLSNRVAGCRDLYNPASTTSIYRTGTHGTQVFSIMATDSMYGLWGTAPEADYYLIRSENTDSEIPFEEDMWVMAAELADSVGVDLINSSLGYAFFDNIIYDHEQSQLACGDVFISQGASVAASKGILVCSAAGNERRGTWGTLLFPSDVREVLTVAATDSEGASAYFTSPGFLTPWVKPNVACRGLNAYTIHWNSGLTTSSSGTSYATPFMCGLAASLWGAAPSLTAQEIHHLICASADAYATPDSITGYGHPNFATALSEALRLEEEYESLSHLGSVTSDSEDATPTPTSRSGLYDLMGRRLAVPPLRGCYIEDGRLRMRR